jgi:hypothetical protein
VAILVEGEFDSDTLLSISGPCIVCKKSIQSFLVPLKAYKEWQAGKLIQEAFPQLTADQREFLISRVCGPCFDEVTKEPE